MSLNPEKVLSTLQEAGLEGFLLPDRVPSLLEFTQRMLEANKTLNLTRWTQEQTVLVRHLLDSAQALPDLWPFLKPSSRWMDLGTGCGFPGALLTAARPEVEWTFLDSVAKKTRALEGCLQGLGWNAKTLNARAEDLGRDPKTRESWQGILARAVADLPTLLEYALPLLCPGGYLVNWMTQEQSEAVARAQGALEILSGRVVKKKTYSLPGLDQERFLLIVEKMGKTPDLYPRPSGQASKHPL